MMESSSAPVLIGVGGRAGRIERRGGEERRRGEEERWLECRLEQDRKREREGGGRGQSKNKSKAGRESYSRLLSAPPLPHGYDVL